MYLPDVSIVDGAESHKEKVKVTSVASLLGMSSNVNSASVQPEAGWKNIMHMIMQGNRSSLSHLVKWMLVQKWSNMVTGLKT